ncbi:MAG: protein kinase domain-containing protein [Methanobacterium sp.]
MNKCPACNTVLPEKSKFCLECGYNFYGGQTGKLGTDTVLENRYVIIRTLGQGGMGAVYLALDQRLNNTAVAIKEMSTNAVGTGKLQDAREAFKKEASMLINLRHPALPVVRDFFSQGEERCYLVMDYIEGQTLKEIAEKRGPIPEAEVLDWAWQLCVILDYLHSQNPPVIFRDLKPANIMLTPQGQIKLIDFGIARHFQKDSSHDTSAYGSSGFAPPEQYGNNQTDARSDVYALGATMHYLLTGIDPILNPFNFEPPSKTVKITMQLETAVMKALKLKAENRPRNIQAMMELLPVRTGSQQLPKAVSAAFPNEANTMYLDACQQHLQMPQNSTIPMPVQYLTEREPGPVSRQNQTDDSQPKKSNVKIILVIAACLLLLLSGGYYFQSSYADKQVTAREGIGSPADNNMIASQGEDAT